VALGSARRGTAEPPYRRLGSVSESPAQWPYIALRFMTKSFAKPTKRRSARAALLPGDGSSGADVALSQELSAVNGEMA